MFGLDRNIRTQQAIDYRQVRRKIETRKDWFCEAVWDGDFDDGDFDQTDIVAGSGARHRNQNLTFVSAGSLMDRLQYIQVGKATYISNSIL